MINIYSYGYCVVIDNNVDIDKLNNTMCQYLQSIDSSLRDGNINRILEINKNYLLITPYGDLKFDNLIYFIRRFLEQDGHKYNDLTKESMPTDILEQVKANKGIPNLQPHKGCQFGGKSEDSQGIDDGIKPLCDVINSFKGIETFSSCEGHISRHGCTAYVLFVVDNMDTLNNFSEKSDVALEKLFMEHGVTRNDFNWTLMFSYGRWPNRTGVHFELRIIYTSSKQEEVFNQIKCLADYLKDS